MSDRETDFDFDFFEESETQEAPARTRQLRRAPRPGRRIRPPSGLTPLLRLVGLIAFAIAVVVVLVLAVQSCRSEDKRAKYADYMQEMRPIARDSQSVGRQLNGVLTTPGVKLNQIQGKLDGLVQQQQQDLTHADAVTPPGRLRDQHDHALEALSLRVSGLQRLQQAFRETQRLKRSAVAGRLLAAQMRRFVASDVIWTDEFRDGSAEVLRREGVTGVQAPPSTFLRDPELATPRVLASFWTRIHGATTGKRGPGPHGNGLVSVKALPDGQVLSPDEDNLVIARTGLAFQATVENSGNSQEVRVRVVLDVQQKARPIKQTRVIDAINPGQRKTVTFTNLGDVVQFTEPVPVRVRVLPVQGEENTGNNSATYTVTFRVPPP